MPRRAFGLDADAVLDAMDSGDDGLSQREARQRLNRHGRNRIGRRREVSVWRVIVHQFTSPLIYVLLGALVVTLATAMITGEQRWADAIVIGLVLVVNGTVGFLQEYRAEHAVEALMKMVAPKATVRRDGQREQIDADQIVPGDLVLLSEGNVVPADVRLRAVQSLQVNEAALTGESVPVNKTDQSMADADETLPPADQRNMAFMGTAVTAGRAEGIVIATGKQTQIGQIARQVEQADQTTTPLQRRIQRLAVLITWGILAIAVAAFVTGLLMGRDWSRMITLAVALSVAAIPAGLPIVVTVALAIGVRRMARRHAVIRHLPAVDTLGSCTSIVSDKTGTLTQNRMTVRSILGGDARYELTGHAHSAEGQVEQDDKPVEPVDRPALQQTLVAGVMCNEARLPEDHQATHDASAPPDTPDEQAPDESSPSDDEPAGDPMEIALLYAGLKAGISKEALAEKYTVRRTIPFQTESRFMAVICDAAKDPDEGAPDQQSPVVFVKGAPETVLDMCDDQLAEDGEHRELDRDQLIQRNEELAGEGLRVLAMAIGQGEEVAESLDSQAPAGLTLVGMQGLLDPPRPSAIQAVDDSHNAGIRVLMVTGDHARTGSAIARQVHVDRPPAYNTPHARSQGGDGHTSKDPLPRAFTGQDIDEASDEQLDELLDQTNVFARVKPTQKTRIVERMKANNQIVAVTGDGVNDAPALKTAHLGAAMGSGTDVAKEASDMVITDDNFSSVYAAVEQGRAAFGNIRMATFFLLSTGAADVLIILSALALGWPLPLLPAQILWCNVVTNGIADVALAFEPGEEALYRRPPRPPAEGILDGTLLERLVIVGIWLALGVLGMFLWVWEFDFATFTGNPENLTLARTAALTTLVLFQKVHVFNCRSEDVSIFRKSLMANKLLFIGVITSLLIHIAAIYIPLTQNLLSLAPLDWTTWLIATAVASTAIIVNELHKWLRPRRFPGMARSAPESDDS